MANDNPYAPPASRVASDSPANPKLLKQLLEAWPDDTGMLTKLRRLRIGCIVVLSAVAVYLAMVLQDQLALNNFTLVIAILGGLIVGFALYLESALRQWPTLKKYFNWEQMQKDHENHGGSE